MTRRLPHAGWLIGGMIVVLLTMMVYARQPVPAITQAPIPAAPAVKSPLQGSQYLGSGACQRCHEPEFETWSNTLHIQMTKPTAAAKIEGDFGGTASSHLQQNGWT